MNINNLDTIDMRKVRGDEKEKLREGKGIFDRNFIEQQDNRPSERQMIERLYQNNLYEKFGQRQQIQYNQSEHPSQFVTQLRKPIDMRDYHYEYNRQGIPILKKTRNYELIITYLIILLIMLLGYIGASFL